jgi:hypothetical protein
VWCPLPDRPRPGLGGQGRECRPSSARRQTRFPLAVGSFARGVRLWADRLQRACVADGRSPHGRGLDAQGIGLGAQ